MATANTIQRKPCCKCDKGSGIFTCDGCQQSFCRKHSDEHRQELSIQMDSIGQEHDILQRDINQESDTHPILSRIDLWERESIDKIQQVANEARNDLNQLINQKKQEFITVMSRLSEDLQSSRESENYTELDLKKWIDELNELRQDVQQSINAYLVDKTDARSVIRLIQVKNSQQLHSTVPSSQTSIDNERFGIGDEEIKLSENNLVATYGPSSLSRSAFLFGVKQYSVGKHQIRFRIENTSSNIYFTGIVTFSQTDLPNIFSSTSTVHGWWPCYYAVVFNVNQGEPLVDIMKTGDELTLTLDCDKRQISIIHERTRSTEQLSVDIEKCSFPWKLVVGLGSIGSSIRIIQ